MNTIITCPTCGRRHRLRRATPHAPLPLFAWAASNQRVVSSGARLLLRADMLDADGEPRACITVPGRRHPLVYPTVTAAVAALRAMEAAHAVR